MTLEQIKNEITAKLKEVRESSRDFSGCESFDDLQSLFKKAIGRVALCESAEDIEAVGDLLMAIEELYNDCNSEFLNQQSEIELFSFDFELDEESEYPDEESETEEETEAEEYESEEAYNESDEYDGDYEQPQIKGEKKTSSNKPPRPRLDLTAVKSDFDQKNPAHKLRKPNIVRLCVGCVAVLSGVGFGLVDALWWPWEWYAWSIIGFGVSYLLLAAIYATAISRNSKKAVRSMAITRLALALVMLVLSLVLGLLLPYDLTVGGAYIATLPFTVFGIATYYIYRFRLFLALKKSKKVKKK